MKKLLVIASVLAFAAVAMAEEGTAPAAGTEPAKEAAPKTAKKAGGKKHHKEKKATTPAN